MSFINRVPPGKVICDMSVMWYNSSLCKSLREKLRVICGWLCKEAIHVRSSGVGNKGNYGRSLFRWILAECLRRNKVLVIGERVQSCKEIRGMVKDPPCLARM
jgi:hypothetical protein